MNNNIQCSIESSTTKIELNSAVDGVFLVPELEGLVGLPEIRTTSGVNAGYDGGWTSAQNYDARLISIRGVIANPDISKVEDKRRAIASLLGQGRKEQLTLRFTTEAGNAYAISVRTISCEMALQRVLTTQEFLIQLRADDPLIYDDGTTGGIAAILQPQRALGGFEINFGLPLAIGGGAEDTVVDNGNETVYPVIKLYGALHSPTVVNRTTNQQMQILADLQYSIDWHTYRSATGDYILVNDGLNGAPMTLTQLLGNAEQTTYSGKNLFNFDKFISDNVSVQGVTRGTATYTSNSITLTATSNDCFTKYNFPTNLYPVITVSQNTDVTLSWKTNNTSGTNKGVVYVFGNNNGAATVIINAQDRAEHCTFNTGSYTEISFRVGVANSGDTLTYSDIQVEQGSTATAYEPYVGGTPAPNPSYPQPISTVTGEQTVTVTGKNLVEDTISGSSIDANGIIRSNSDFDTQVAFVVEGKTYTLSYTGEIVVGGYFATKPTINSVSIDGTRIVNNNRTFVAQYTGYFTFRTNAGESNAQCELGSTATTYEPYQEQSYEVNLGKNLFDKDNSASVLNAYIDNSQSVITANSNNRIIWIKCEPNTTYTIQRGWASGGVKLVAYTTSQPAVGVQTYEPKGWGAGQTSVSYTTGADARFIVVRIWQFSQDAEHTVDEMLASVQIEKGGQATSYAPYFTPIELAKVGNYQDRIYKDDGKWYIEKQIGKVVLDGSESYAYYSNYGGFRYQNANFNISSANPSEDLICSHFTVATVRGILPTAPVIKTYTQSADSTYIFLCDGTSDVDAFKTWLSTHPTTVYYALATPTTTEITDETLRAQLNFLASLYKGENNISLVGTGAQGGMVISYATDYTVNQDIITIDSQARTITLNGQDVYHLKTSESEFLVLAPGENKLYLTSEVSDDSGYAEVKFKQGYLSI